MQILYKTFGGRRPYVEDDLMWKTTFGGRRPLVEEDLRGKMNFIFQNHDRNFLVRVWSHFLETRQKQAMEPIFLMIGINTGSLG